MSAHADDMIDAGKHYNRHTPIRQPVKVVTGWHREFDRNTGNCDSFPHYVVTYNDGSTETSYSWDNRWEGLTK